MVSGDRAPLRLRVLRTRSEVGGHSRIHSADIPRAHLRTGGSTLTRAPDRARLADFGIERDGVPVIRPEIALLYKSKRPRKRDEADLRSALPHLDRGSRMWLAGALTATGGPGPWTRLLEGQGA